MNFNIFVSYTMRDGQVSENALREIKSKFPETHSVFIDRLASEKTIHPQLLILKKILQSHLVVLVVSERVYKSPWVLLELLVAAVTLTPVIRIPASVTGKSA